MHRQVHARREVTRGGSDSASIGRRDFIAGGVAAVAVAASSPSEARGRRGAGPGAAALIASEPVLQNAADVSMGVSFEVSADASGWVECSLSPDMADARRVYSGGRGLMTVDDRVALVRLTGLSPATRYWYRVGADRIRYRDGYHMENLGSETGGTIHSFTTLGPGARGAFCVINDTHDRKSAVGRVLSKIAGINPALVIWNGDASNCSETIDTALGIFMHPHPDHPAYAADTPYIFISGNHDFRGRFNRRLGDLMMYREPSERAPEFAELGRNFVQRLGDVALIGLDTGEDKLDTNPLFAGIFRMKEYRELQTRWLEWAVETPAVRTARFRVAFCHIPLSDPRPDENPGDVAPADVAPQYTRDYARWQRTCAKMWGPILDRAGVKLVISGHQHSFRYDPRDTPRTWAQLVGGGPFTDAEHDGKYPTVIEGCVEGDALKIAVHDVWHGRTVKTISVPPCQT